MSRFTNSLDVTGVKGTGTTKLLTSVACDDALMMKATGALEDAVKLLMRTQAIVAGKAHSKNVLRYAHRYFLTSPTGLTQLDKISITTVLTRTLNGLKSDVTLKIGNLGGSTLGSVSFSDKTPSKPHHSRTYDLEEGKPRTTGAIKMSDSLFAGNDRLAVVTLIHEATHKFAGTRDYSYFTDDGAKATSTFTDKTSALDNADSYAWFALKVGRSFNIFQTNNLMFSPIGSKRA